MASMPTALPILAAGRHRSPRHGACLMEYTSVLAGERFSDSPHCTDPVLAAVARAVNDYSGDGARQRIAPYAGDLTTAHGAGDEVHRGIVRRCLLTALRTAGGTRRHVLLVALLGLDRAAAGADRGWDGSMLSIDSELALLGQESGLADAAASVAVLPVSAAEHAKRALRVDVEIAVATIAESAGSPDDVLFQLFLDCLEDYRDALVVAGQGSRLACAADSTS
jgi:hypothetical protein